MIDQLGLFGRFIDSTEGDLKYSEFVSNLSHRPSSSVAIALIVV